MSTSASANATAAARAIRAWTEGRRICVALVDGREVSFPAEKYRRLGGATEEQLREVQIEARGRALRWESIDEDLSIDGILAGRWLP